MKKALSCMLCIALVLSLFLSAVAAPPADLTWDGSPATLSELAQNTGLDMVSSSGAYKPLYYASATELWNNGLFLGSGTSFDLDNSLTRAEGVVMTIRMLGKEAEAKAVNLSMTFTDVPDWAAPHVAYAAQHGITKGYSSTAFGSSDPMTAAQFITLALRAMGYEDNVDFSWDTSYDTALEIGLISQASHAQYSRSNLFLRDNAVIVAYNAVFETPTKSGDLLSETISMPGKPSGTVPTAVKETQVTTPDPGETGSSAFGNNLDAMGNSATRVISGSKIYWIDNDAKTLSSADYPSLGNQQVLCKLSFTAHSLNLSGNTLYFYQLGFSTTESGIYKVGTDASGYEIVKGGVHIKLLAMANNTFFYIPTSGKEVRKCAIDGSGDTSLLEIGTHYDFRVTASKLLVVDGGALYSYNHDGSGKTQLVTQVNRIATDGGTIFLQEFNSTISSINMDGSGKKTICSILNTGRHMACSSGYVYMSVGNVILRYNVSTGGMTYIPCDVSDGLFVASDYTHSYDASVANSTYTDKKGVSQIQSTSVYKITSSSTSYEAKINVDVTGPGLVVYQLSEEMSSGTTRTIISVVYHATTGPAGIICMLTGNNPVQASIIG